jgi:ribose transport system permease protein
MLVLLFGLIASPDFRTAENFRNLPTQMVVLLAVSLAQMILIISGNIDWSIGPLMSIVTCVLSYPISPVLALLICLGVSTAVGVMNGMLVGYGKLNPLIVTLGSMTLLQGVALMIRKIPGGHIPDFLIFLDRGRLFGIPIPLFAMIILLAVAFMIIKRTDFGVHIFAIGSARENAQLSGVNVKGVIMKAYIVSSLITLVAGVLLAGRITIGSPTIGNPFGMNTLFVAVLGGASVMGGSGGIAGLLFGVLIFGLLSNVMNLLNIQVVLQTAVRSVLLLAILYFHGRNEKEVFTI